MEVLTIPGWTGSGPDHWQSHWERARENARRVEMPDWDRPRLEGWVIGLSEAIRKSPASVVLAAHSLGCLAVVHWAALDPAGTARVAGALLVAPPDVERDETPVEIRGFAPIPRGRLPFRTIVAGSSNDGWSDENRVRSLAEAWGARYEDLGAAGHVNTAAGYGPFPRGEALLAEILGGPGRPVG